MNKPIDDEMIAKNLDELLSVFNCKSDYMQHMINGGHILHRIFSILKGREYTIEEKMDKVNLLINNHMIEYQIKFLNKEIDIVNSDDFAKRYLLNRSDK